MAHVFDAPANELIEKLAANLKNAPEIKPPEWARFAKTGCHKERPPTDREWWYKRSAAVLRSVYKLGPVGVSKLRTKYGGKKNRGVKPEKFYKAGGNILRKILQQLESAKLVKSSNKGVHKGRVVTPKGISLLDKTAGEIIGKRPKKESAPKIEAPKDIEEKDAKKEGKPADSTKTHKKQTKAAEDPGKNE